MHPFTAEFASVDSAAALLDEAEDILNEVGARVRAEVEDERWSRRRGWKRFFRRKR